MRLHRRPLHRSPTAASTAEKPIVEVTRVLRSQSTSDVEEMPCDNIQEHEDHELDQVTKVKKGKSALECTVCTLIGERLKLSKKIQLWTTLKMYYVVDEKLKDWLKGSAAKKCGDFKSELNTLYFDDKTDEELQVGPSYRVIPKNWEELVAFWKSGAAQQHPCRRKSHSHKNIIRERM
ncbi:hypothetical protein ZWY2020_010922 [Hordeum vulgare]|nr:hypothetical protein ZWY2020_010922 [Hordeum vulgare]